VRRGPGRAGQAPDQRSPAPGLIMGTSTFVIFNFGTYLAQRPAFRCLRPHTAAYPTGGQDHGGLVFPQVTSTNLQI
jgi:hypothetical protein